MTPLQIAVVFWDSKAIEKLLNAGANPDAVGQNGLEWAQDTYMQQFNFLHGASPLHIIKHLECQRAALAKADLGLDEAARKRIETCLLELGAVEIAPESSEPGVKDFSDSDES